MNELKAYQVYIPDFGDVSPFCYIAAKSRDQAKFCAVESIHENYYGGSVDMGKCFRYVKSVKRHPAYDGLIDQRRTAPRFISGKGGDGQ